MATRRDTEMARKNATLEASCVAGVEQLVDEPLTRYSFDLTDALEAIRERAPDAHRPWYMQFWKAASSIGANYAEGIGRADTQDQLKFMKNARGSAYECWFWARISRNQQLMEEVKRICILLDTAILAHLCNCVNSATLGNLPIGEGEQEKT